MLEHRQLFLSCESNAKKHCIDFENKLRLLCLFQCKNKYGMHFDSKTRTHDVNNIAYKINCKQLRDNYIS